MKTFLKYFGDMLVVAFGIFLGILVTDWKNQKKVENEVDKSIFQIHSELDNNREQLNKSIIYHRMIKANLDSILADYTEEDMQLVYFRQNNFRLYNIKGWHGVNLPGFENIAFESAKLKGIIREIDIELLTSISRMYKKQNKIADYGNTIVEKFLNMNSETKTIDVVGILELLLYDYLYSEEFLLTKLELMIDELSCLDQP